MSAGEDQLSEVAVNADVLDAMDNAGIHQALKVKARSVFGV
jgi:hypothetical protein